jgi:tetratricopeptide (TPR) repeat protein
MAEIQWEETEKETADLYQQMGEAYFISGDTDAALGRYDDAIHVLSKLSNQQIFLHQKRGQMLIEQARTNAAKREIQLAEYELETFKGVFNIARGRFAQAQSNFNSALALSEVLEDEMRQAKAKRYLAMGYGNLGNIPEAHKHATEAMNYYQKVGNRLQLESLRAELAGYYLNAERFEEVITPAEEALKFFENIQHSARIGYLCSNLAEAYYERGQMETAEQYANRALQSGTPRVEPYVYYTLGLINNQRNDIVQAEKHFQRGISQAELAEEYFIAAYLYRAYGRMLLENDNKNEGTNKLIKALTLFANLSMQHEVEKTQELLGL